jgi:hypothetical protein
VRLVEAWCTGLVFYDTTEVFHRSREQGARAEIGVVGMEFWNPHDQRYLQGLTTTTPITRSPDGIKAIQK